MKTLISTLCIAASILAAGLLPGPVHADSDSPIAGFFSGIEDFPLMPDLTELPDATLIFDSPSGRFVEAYAYGRITASDLENFYSTSLPQLGWSATSPSSYQREGEVLVIAIIGPVADDGTQTVRFSISPDGGGTDNN